MSKIDEFFLNGKAPQQPATKKISDHEMYRHMHQQGKKRFGSPCKHDYVKHGKCMKCLRQVVSSF